MLNSQPNYKGNNAQPHTMSCIHRPNIVNCIRDSSRSAQTWPALEPVLLLREACAHGNPQDRAFPSNPALLPPPHRPPPARSTPQAAPSPLHQTGPPYQQSPAAPTGRFVRSNSEAADGSLNRRALAARIRRRSSCWRAFRMRVFHQPVPLLSSAWFYSSGTTSWPLFSVWGSLEWSSEGEEMEEKKARRRISCARGLE
jgi:hypothetical protein